MITQIRYLSPCHRRAAEVAKTVFTDGPEQVDGKWTAILMVWDDEPPRLQRSWKTVRTTSYSTMQGAQAEARMHGTRRLRGDFIAYCRA